MMSKRHLLRNSHGFANYQYLLIVVAMSVGAVSIQSLGTEIDRTVADAQVASAATMTPRSADADPLTPGVGSTSNAAVGTWTRMARGARHLFADKYTKAARLADYAVGDFARGSIGASAARRQLRAAEELVLDAGSSRSFSRYDTANKLVDSIESFRKDPQALRVELEQALLDDVSPVLRRLESEELDYASATKLHGELMAAFSGERGEGYQAQLLRRLVPEGTDPELDRLHGTLTDSRERRWKAWWVLESSVRGFGMQEIPVVTQLPKTARVDATPMETLRRLIAQVPDPKETSKLMPIAVDTEYRFVVDPSYSRIQSDLHKMATDEYLLAHPEHHPTLNGQYVDSDALRTQRQRVADVIAIHNHELRQNAARFFDDIARGKNVDTSAWSWAEAYQRSF